MNSLDSNIFNFLYSFTNRSEILDFFLVFTARVLPWILAIWIIYTILRRKDWQNNKPAWKNRFQHLALGFIAVILSRGIVANIINTLFQSPRPFSALGVDPLISHAANGSFPSGHMSILIPLTMLLFLVNKKAAWWSLVLTLMIGIARVTAAVHWPIDILGGIGVGVLSFFVVKLFFDKRKLI